MWEHSGVASVKSIMRTTICLALLLGTINWCCAANADPPPPTAAEACQRLMAVTRFAFGGVGFAGTTSTGEHSFKTVLASDDGLKLFHVILAKGSDEAKLYALCGIRRLEPQSFETAATPLVKKNPEVTTMSGCLVQSEEAATVVKRISSGVYDSFASGK